MAAQQLTPDEIREAEGTVRRLKGVEACRISTDENGRITEIHVVATADKPARLIARDVETCLKAEMNLDVDHRAIGVVMFDPPDPHNDGHNEKARPAPEPAAVAPAPAPQVVPAATEEFVPEFPVEEFASRFAFRSVNLFMSHEGTRAEVELTREGIDAFGNSESRRPGRSPYGEIAEATLQAVSEFLDETTRLCLGDVRRVAIDDTYIVIAKVDLVTPRDRKSLAGASVIAGNENQSVVFATLDAVNRVLGKLDFKSAVEYKIK
jgi:hypothetical protein